MTFKKNVSSRQTQPFTDAIHPLMGATIASSGSHTTDPLSRKWNIINHFLLDMHI